MLTASPLAFTCLIYFLKKGRVRKKGQETERQRGRSEDSVPSTQLFLSVILFIWKANRKRDKCTEKKRVNESGLPAQMAVMVRAGPGQSQEAGTPSRPPLWVAETHAPLGYFLLLFQGHLAGSWIAKWSSWDSNQPPYGIPASQVEG